MITDEELSDAMRNLESDSPAEADVAAAVRARINRGNKFRNTALASLAAVAAVAAIVTTTSFLRSPAQPSQVPPDSTPQSQAISTPTSVSAPVIQPTSDPTTTPPTTTPPASSGPTNTPPTTTNNPAVTGSSARCYTTADLNRTDNHLAISINGPMGPYAMEICQQNWAEGVLFTTPPFIRNRPGEPGQSVPAGPGQSVPNLVACVLRADMSDEGTEEVAIIPGTEDTCTQLDLPQYTG